jgi:hypothetical protein
MADVLMTYLMNVLHKYKLSDKIIAFCGNNCNTNFGGSARRGTDNVFANINTSNLKMNIHGVGCAAHIFHNALQTSGNILPIDVKAIVNKIFQCFHIYTVWVEGLLEFCDFVYVEYKKILGSVKTRWLSLQPAVTIVISMFPALKSYFLSQEKCLTMLRKMFSETISLVWIYFWENQVKVCSISMKKIQSDSISGSEVAIELDILSNKMKSRRYEYFHTTKLISPLSDVKDVYSNGQFTKLTNSFYNTFLLYLGKWNNSVLPLDMFHWTLLKNPPTWGKIYIVGSMLLMLTQI